MRLLLLLALIQLSCILRSQDTKALFTKSEFRGEDSYLINYLPYPESLLNKNKSGNIVLLFCINKSGVLDSIKVESVSRGIQTNEVTDFLLKTQNKWTPTYLNSNPITYWYRFVVYYNFIVKDASSSSSNEKSITYYERAMKLYQKEKYKSALKVISAAIRIRPYKSSYFELRHNIYNGLNMEIEAKKDKLEYEKLAKEVLKAIEVNMIKTLIQ